MKPQAPRSPYPRTRCEKCGDYYIPQSMEEWDAFTCPACKGGVEE